MINCNELLSDELTILVLTLFIYFIMLMLFDTDWPVPVRYVSRVDNEKPSRANKLINSHLFVTVCLYHKIITLYFVTWFDEFLDYVLYKVYYPYELTLVIIEYNSGIILQIWNKDKFWPFSVSFYISYVKPHLPELEKGWSGTVLCGLPQE